jgi:hypothetical protein
LASPRDEERDALQSPKTSSNTTNNNANAGTGAIQTRARDKSTPTDFSKVVVTDPQLHQQQARGELTSSNPTLPSPRTDEKRKAERKESTFSFGKVLKKTIAPMICMTEERCYPLLFVYVLFCFHFVFFSFVFYFAHS